MKSIGLVPLLLSLATTSCAVSLDATFRPVVPAPAAATERGPLRRLDADPAPPPYAERDKKLGSPIAMTTIGSAFIGAGIPMALVGYSQTCPWSDPSSGRCFAKATWPTLGLVGAIIGGIILPIGVWRLAHDAPDETTHEPASSSGRVF